MKRAIALIGILILAGAAPVAAGVGFAIGGKIGYANYDGDVLPSSGDLGGATYYGLVLELTTIPVIDFEFHANYFTKTITYGYEYMGYSIDGDFEFQDLHMLGMIKKNLIQIPASPVSLYIGAGVGMHFMNTEVFLDLANSGLTSPIVVDPFAIAQDAARMSADGLIGLKLAFPVMPLAVFGETRYGVIFTDQRIRTLQMEVGVLLDF